MAINTDLKDATDNPEVNERHWATVTIASDASVTSLVGLRGLVEQVNDRAVAEDRLHFVSHVNMAELKECEDGVEVSALIYGSQSYDHFLEVVSTEMQDAVISVNVGDRKDAPRLEGGSIISPVLQS